MTETGVRYVKSTGLIGNKWHVIECWISLPPGPNPGARRYDTHRVRWWNPAEVVFFLRDRWTAYKMFGRTT